MARNWLYYALGTFSYTIEVSLGYQPPGYRVDSICQRVANGVYYLLDRAHGSGITGHVTDSATGVPLVAEVKVLEATSTPDTIAPRMSDSLFGRYWHPLRGDTTYTVEFSRWDCQPRTISGVRVERGRMTEVNVALARREGVEESTNDDENMLNSSFVIHVHSSLDNVRFTCRLAHPGDIRLDVFDRNGRMIRELVSGRQPVGERTCDWDGCSRSGRPVASGVYFARLSGSTGAATAKFLIER